MPGVSGLAIRMYEPFHQVDRAERQLTLQRRGAGLEHVCFRGPFPIRAR